MKRTAITVVLVVGLLTLAVAPAAAQSTANPPVDECKNSDAGPSGDGGPPGFVGGLVPDFLGDLLSNLPVPGFLKSWAGAESC